MAKGRVRSGYKQEVVSSLVLNAMSEEVRKIPKYVTICVILYFCLGTGPRSQDPVLKRNGVKVSSDRRMENGVSFWCIGQCSKNRLPFF